METFSNNNSAKICMKYYCKICDYGTCRKSSYDDHILSLKHNKATESNTNSANSANSANSQNHYVCQICQKIYNNRTGLWRHNKKCNSKTNIDSNLNKEHSDKDLIMMLIKENSEFKNFIMEQQNIMLELAKNSQNTNTNNSHNTTNSHNKSFNLQFFLNETCKNAMNITDFVNSLQLQLCDLEKVGELGYVEGIFNIIIKNLNALDVTERPIHCTDKKRETMYVKDENKWEKEDDSNTKLHKMVRKVSNKNIDLISEFKEVYPDWKKSTSKVSDKFDKIIIESMGGKGENDYEKEEKIIKRLAKEVPIPKYSEI
jgi:hypothetical protein